MCNPSVEAKDDTRLALWQAHESSFTLAIRNWGDENVSGPVGGQKIKESLSSTALESVWHWEGEFGSSNAG